MIVSISNISKLQPSIEINTLTHHSYQLPEYAFDYLTRYRLVTYFLPLLDRSKTAWAVVTEY